MINPENEEDYYVIGDVQNFDYTIPAAKVEVLDVTKIEDVELNSAVNFKAEAVTEEQLATYGEWYADFVLTVNKDVTLCADGTSKRVDELSGEESLLVWDFVNGTYAVAPASIVINHGYDNYYVVNLEFADGNIIKIINTHAFFDSDTNRFEYITKENASEYIGHSFVKNANGELGTSELVNVEITNEATYCYSVLTAVNYNCFVNGVLSLTPEEVVGENFLMPYVIGDDMKYDADLRKADIEKYGLFTYDDLKEYMSYEEFIGFGFADFKVSIGKGLITFDELLELIKTYCKG